MKINKKIIYYGFSRKFVGFKINNFKFSNKAEGNSKGNSNNSE